LQGENGPYEFKRVFGPAYLHGCTYGAIYHAVISADVADGDDKLVVARKLDALYHSSEASEVVRHSRMLVLEFSSQLYFNAAT
jgi:hypothetical protein